MIDAVSTIQAEATLSARNIEPIRVVGGRLFLYLLAFHEHSKVHTTHDTTKLDPRYGYPKV